MVQPLRRSRWRCSSAGGCVVEEVKVGVGVGIEGWVLRRVERGADVAGLLH